MATHKQLMVEVPVTTRGMGFADTTTVNACFPASPIHAAEINDQSSNNIKLYDVVSVINLWTVPQLLYLNTL